MGGQCQSKLGECINVECTLAERCGCAMTAEKCWAGGGHKWWNWSAPGGASDWVYNPNAPCDSMTRCDGTQTGLVGIGGKACGKDNIEYLCVSSPNGGVWNASPYECDAGSVGMCPTSCGEIVLCDGRKVATSKIGAKVCGEKDGKYINFTCDKDGKWHAAEECKCMTICPDLKGCSGNLTKQKIGAEVCGDDRKMHICMANLNAPPEWSYGKKCACPGDPPEVVAPAVSAVAAPAVSAVAAPTTATPTATSASAAAAPAAAPRDNSTLVAGVFLFVVFIILIAVAIMLARRGKAGGGRLPSDGYPMGYVVEKPIDYNKP